MHTSPFQIRNIRLFLAFRIFFNARFYYPVFTILFLDFGLSIEQFALLNTVWAITIVLAEVPSGALADLLGRKYLIVTTSCLMVVEMCLLAFVPLGNGSLIFTAFLINRVLSGLAEAMASGADEAIAYDSLVAEGLADQWPQVLSLQMRLRSLASILTMTIGALLYDPSVVNLLLKWLHLPWSVDLATTMRFPIYLTLILALLAVATALRLQEPPREKEPGEHFHLLGALRLTLQAGAWIARTPFALAVILFGMGYDHVLRMIVTMTSQYFRLIDLPDGSFGVIASAMALLGLFVPKVAERMVAGNSPIVNIAWLSGITLLALFGLSGFFPYWGLLPMALVYVGLLLVSFFSSHYLNQITESRRRATVLSFNGMAFNLAYGLIGFFFALLIAHLRAVGTAAHPEWDQTLIANTAFVQAIGWFPWYCLGCLLLIFLFTRRRWRRSGGDTGVLHQPLAKKGQG
jgi:MFS family permease